MEKLREGDSSNPLFDDTIKGVSFGRWAKDVLFHVSGYSDDLGKAVEKTMRKADPVTPEDVRDMGSPRRRKTRSAGALFVALTVP